MKNVNFKNTKDVYQEIRILPNGHIEIPYVESKAASFINAVWNKLNGQQSVGITIMTQDKEKLGGFKNEA